MAVFRLVFSDEDFEARKTMFVGRAANRKQIWVWADNEVQVALTFPEATIERLHVNMTATSYSQLGSYSKQLINYVIE